MPYSRNQSPRTVLSNSCFQTLTEVQTTLPGRPPQATMSSHWKDSSAGQRADGKEQNPSLGNSQASIFRLWLETWKTLLKWRSRRWKCFDKVKRILGNFNPFLLTFIWQMEWTPKHWQYCSLKLTNSFLFHTQDSAACPVALPQTSSQVTETPNWPWVRGISQLLVALQQIYDWLHDGKKACLQLSDTQGWAA